MCKIYSLNGQPLGDTESLGLEPILNTSGENLPLERTYGSQSEMSNSEVLDSLLEDRPNFNSIEFSMNNSGNPNA